MAKKLPWGHTSRHCLRCGKVGPRCLVLGGYVHFYCLTENEKRERSTKKDSSRG
jgi:hypothetical protein